MPWIPLESRSSELQRQVAAASSAAASPSADFYNQNDLGLLADGELFVWLVQAEAGAKAQNQHASEPDSEPEDLPEIGESGASDARSLRWVRLNGRTAADKAYAKQRYRQLLFELWRKHIAETGETYYPKLRNDLMDRYSLMSDPNHN